MTHHEENPNMPTTHTDMAGSQETPSFVSAVRRIEALTQEMRREGLGAFEKAEAAYAEVQTLRAVPHRGPARPQRVAGNSASAGAQGAGGGVFVIENEEAVIVGCDA